MGVAKKQGLPFLFNEEIAMEGQGSPSALKKRPPLYFYNFYRGLSDNYGR